MTSCYHHLGVKISSYEFEGDVKIQSIAGDELIEHLIYVGQLK